MGDVIKLRPRAVKPKLERDIVSEIRQAISRLPWATVWRNNTGALPNAQGRLVQYGLCEGSSDLIGIVQLPLELNRDGMFHVGRFFALEVKRPGFEPTENQLRFMAIVRGQGGAAECVTSADDAVSFLERARRMEL